MSALDIINSLLLARKSKVFAIQSATTVQKNSALNFFLTKKKYFCDNY
jgi:hypothetical protein